MIKRLYHRLGVLTACFSMNAVIAGCGEATPGQASTAREATGSGGSPASTAPSLLAAAPCLACAEPKCPSEAKTCSSTEGCAEFATCLLACSVSGSGCSAQCSTSNASNANASIAAAAYAGCAVLACPSACTPTAGTGGGSGTVYGQGGASNGQSGDTAGSTGSGGQAVASGAMGGAPATGVNLIKDPDFAAVSAYWSATENGGDAATMACSGGQCCITNEYDTWFAFSLGYPRSSLQAFAVEGGAPYTLSFRVRGSTVNSLEVKIGQAVSPYTTIYSALVTVSSTLSEYSRQVTPTATEASAGLVFNAELGAYGSICFSNVALTKN